VLAILLAAALAAPAVVDTAPPAAAPAGAPATAPPKAADDPLVCRSETPIGTKLPKRTCIRKSERDRQERESKDALQLIQRRSSGPSPERM
jgi:hypothetical protein